MSQTPPPGFGDEDPTRPQPTYQPEYPSPYQSPQAQQPPYSQPEYTQPLQTQAPTQPSRGRGSGLVATALAGSLLLGGAAGLGGAAAYDRLFSDDNTSAAASDERTTSPVIDQGASPGGEGSVEAVAETVLPSVVRIDVSTAQGSGSGSGIILSSDGQILTNNHVIDGATDGQITVSFDDGTRASARVLGADPLTDTAVIQADGVSGLTPATIGQSSNLRVGQSVVAIGSPFGLDATVTSGIVSALRRPVNVGTADDQGNSTTYPAIQTDAAINPGNSGGPLVDLTGSVVGINSSIRTTSSSSSEQSGSIGLGFAIPIDEIMPIVEQMAAGQTPTHARLGISVSDAAGSDALGAEVQEVSAGSTAEQAGLRAGDVITAVDGSLIDGSDDLVATVRSFRPGDEVEIRFSRDGGEQSVTLTLDGDAEE